MNTSVEILENSQAKITFGVDAENFEKAMQQAYIKNRSRFNVPGFRKGRAPRKMIEMQFGKEVFYEDAANACVGDAYEEAISEKELFIVSKPDFYIEEISAETGAIFTASVTLKPKALVNNYKGLTYKKPHTVVEEEDILKELNKEAEKNAREITVTDRKIMTDDIVTIDFEGYIDGELFEGGAGKDFDLVIGSHSFIDTFEEQLIGAEVGDDLSVNVTFPEHYHVKELASKPAEFKVEVKDIRRRELPELDDDFAADVSEFDTLEQLKNDIRIKLLEGRELEATNSKKTQLIEALIANSEVNVPEVMLENQLSSEMTEFSRNIMAQGLNLDMYLRFTNQTLKSFRESLKESAEARVKGRLCLEAVAEAEQIEVTENEIQEEIVRVADECGLKPEDIEKLLTEKKEMNGLVLDLKVQKALDLIMENAVAEEDE